MRLQVVAGFARAPQVVLAFGGGHGLHMFHGGQVGLEEEQLPAGTSLPRSGQL